MAEFSKEVKQVHAEVVAAIGRSHAPYSKLHVCSGVQLKGQPHAVIGVNVENASYGGTICAERSALVSAVSQYGPVLDLEFIVVISDVQQGPIPPCGLCLQALREFVSDDFKVYLGDLKSVIKEYRFKELLPVSFAGESLPSDC